MWNLGTKKKKVKKKNFKSFVGAVTPPKASSDFAVVGGDLVT
jgi:hypothetical protein